jgi:hypothetical protein
MSYLDQFKFDKVVVMRLRARKLSIVWKSKHEETIARLEQQLLNNLNSYNLLSEELQTVVKQRDKYCTMLETKLGLLPE